MKAVVLILSLAVGGCASQIIQPQSLSDAEKALTVAHIAYNAVGSELLTLSANGTLHGTAAAQAKIAYDKAGLALDAGDSADRAGSATDLYTAVTEAQTAIAQVQSISGVK